MTREEQPQTVKDYENEFLRTRQLQVVQDDIGGPCCVCKRGWVCYADGIDTCQDCLRRQ